MNANVLEQPVENKSSFKLDFELKELTTNGIVKFHTKNQKNINPFWIDHELVTHIWAL